MLPNSSLVEGQRISNFREVLDDFVSAEIPVRVIVVFVDELELITLCCELNWSTQHMIELQDLGLKRKISAEDAFAQLER